jgi:hypothetical protein
VRIDGRLFGLFAFDVGYEIDLARARQLATPSAAPALEHRRAAPAHLGYATPPLRIDLGSREVLLDGRPSRVATQGTLHEFGAITITLSVGIDVDVETLPTLTSSLAATGTFETGARTLLNELYERVLPAIVKPGMNAFIEDYYIVQCDRIEGATIDEFLARNRAALASTLRCEAATLSDAEIDDVLRSRLSYYPEDLILTEWNVAFIVDPDFKDAINILEHLNVQLLELRFYDALLDRHVADSYGVSAKPPRKLLLHRPYRRTIEELSAIRIDVATIVERIHNALKLSGDLYLAKIYSRTAERLGLITWEKSIADKLDVLQQMYNVLVQRVTTARAELLELTIILLIAVELVLFLAWGVSE